MFDFIKDFLFDHRRSKAWNKAYELAKQRRFAEAAEVYRCLAEETLQHKDLELVYVGDCLDAFKLYLQANESENALKQARNALNQLVKLEWAITDNDEIGKLSQMVGDLYLAGYGAEAKLFSNEVNEQLKSHGLSINISVRDSGFRAALQGDARLARICPQCGGSLSPAQGSESKCPYCKCLIKSEL